MAKIGNESRLILKLAKERAGNHERLQKELDFRGLPGNHPERLGWDIALGIGYRVAVQEYQNILTSIVLELEER